MNTTHRVLLPVGLILLGLLLWGGYFTQPVTLVVDGEVLQVRGLFLTVQDVLRYTGQPVRPVDRLDPSLAAWIPADGRVVLEHARPVSVWTGGLPLTFESPERIPANLLAALNLKLFPEDEVWVNGLRIDPSRPLPRADRLYLQFRPATRVEIQQDGNRQVIYAAGDTLGQALWRAGLPLKAGDRLSLPLETPLREPVAVEMRRARQVTVRWQDQEVTSRTAAVTVGEALAELGLSLQGLDFSQPPEDAPLPADGKIRVVRVREEVLLQQTNVPYGKQLVADPTLELDQRRVITPGKFGVKVSRQRVRYEDGREVSRQTEAEWVAAEPQDQVLGYGTQAVVKTLNTPEGTFEYYRAVPVYATSYSPCQQGTGRCSRSTSSGMLLQKGVVAVTLPWYRLFRGARVYIPGYGVGVIGDVGGGIAGVYWIDLGYSDEDYVPWAQTVTVYFLTPVPANVPPILP
ncbi:uncharacterized protein conserved in bacteria [Anaerolinea thermolimosa]|uniref:ubiquitin-like domain-containing protein n=1 Tax=Anaerolinea thermolimosa TaxID=229919 RepID=UPI0007812458|nr:ubiquitin-like domain-containing protein [Anaerolinea thermolimosa]GAP05342.1 uncharacterized protein conserved in bacteria [Anaerolinea thermolimosa]